MRCECCSRKLGLNEVVHGVRFGVIDCSSGAFLPSRDSAATVICQSCGSRVLKEVYSRLNRGSMLYRHP